MADRYWVGASGAAWNVTTSWSATSGGASGASVPVAGDNAIFDRATTYTVTCTGALSVANFTVSAGTVTFTNTGTLTVSGNFSLSTGTVWSATGLITFSGTAARTITTSATSIAASITFSGVSGTFQLQDALTVSSTQTTTLNNGTLDLNGKTITTGLFASSGSGTRTLAFGTGNIICNAAGGTLWTTDTIVNLTVTGTPVVNISNSGAVATTVTPGQLTEANSISFNFTAGTYSLTFLNLSGVSVKNVNFTGFSGTWAATSSGLIYGDLTLSAGMTLTASAGNMTFSATSGTKIITLNTKTIDFPINFNGVGGTWQLQDALTLGATRTLTLTNGTLDLNGKTLTTGLFSSSNANTRTLAFGTGNIICNAAGGTLWTTDTIVNLTVTGTPVVNISNSGAVATTVTPGQLTEANSISFNFTAGTYALSFLNLSGAAKNVNFTGYAGTLAAISAAVIYGDLTIASGMTLTASTNAMTFGATSGPKTITTSAKTLDFPLTFNGVGGTWQLQDALLMGTTRTLTHTNGTIDLNGKTLTVGTAYTTATGTKNLTFNGGTLVCPTAATTAFNNAVATGYTTTAGTGTGKVSMTAATAKSFVGGGSTFNCTLSNDGAGALTITGANTFTNIANGVQPTSFVFPIATTQTVTNWNVSGTAGNLVTITSGTAGTAATLSKASGTVSSNYLSLKDSTATGGATWYAGANSTNVSGNLGWIFTAPPATNTGNFFFMF